MQLSRAEARSLCTVLLPGPAPVHLHLQSKDAEGEQASPQVELCTPHAPGSSRLMQGSALSAAPSAAASACNSSRRRRRGKRRRRRRDKTYPFRIQLYRNKKENIYTVYSVSDSVIFFLHLVAASSSLLSILNRKEKVINAYKKSYKQSLRVSSGGAPPWEPLIDSKSRAKREEIYSSPIASNKLTLGPLQLNTIMASNNYVKCRLLQFCLAGF